MRQLFPISTSWNEAQRHAAMKTDIIVKPTTWVAPCTIPCGRKPSSLQWYTPCSRLLSFQKAKNYTLIWQNQRFGGRVQRYPNSPSRIVLLYSCLLRNSDLFYICSFWEKNRS